MLPFPINDPRSPCKPYGGNNPSEYHWKNGGVTYVFGMQEVRGMLGARFDCGYVCQAEQLTLEDWEFLAHRTGRAANWLDMHGNPLGQIWGCANPDVSQHWIPKRISEGLLTLFKVGFKDNIIFYRNGAFTPYGEERTAHLKKTITGIRYRRLILGEWCNAEGVVFPEFDEEVHVIDEIPDWVIQGGPRVAYYLGIDYGHSAPLVGGWFAHNLDTNELIGFKEWRMSNTLIEDHINALHQHSEGLPISLRISDHDSQMNHQLKAAGIPTENADKTPGSILRGLDFIRLRLRNKTLKFYRGMLLKEDPVLKERNSARDGIAEFSLYRHKPIEKHVGDSTIDDIPMKGQDDHYIDLTRYIVDRIDKARPLRVSSSIASLNKGAW